jgi:hypothetical protein
MWRLVSIKLNTYIQSIVAQPKAFQFFKMIPSYSHYLEKRCQEYLAANDADMLAAVQTKDKDLLYRIESFRREKMTEAERAVYTEEVILERIRTDPLTRAQFRKDPTRQTIHEQTQIEWIRQNLYSDCVKLPAAKGGTYFDGFKMQTAHPRPATATKTLDIHSPSAHMYGVLKYTTVAGGAQDNQYRDVKHFIQQMRGYLEANPVAPETFLLYLDGAYYTEAKRAELRSMIPEPLKEKIVVSSVQSIAAKV